MIPKGGAKIMEVKVRKTQVSSVEDIWRVAFSPRSMEQAFAFLWGLFRAGSPNTSFRNLSHKSGTSLISST